MSGSASNPEIADVSLESSESTLGQSALTRLRQRVLRRGGYIAFFLAAFFVSFYWTFPYDRLRDWIVRSVELPPEAGGFGAPRGMHLEIVDLAPSWFTGATLTGVHVTKESNNPDEPPLDLVIQELGLRVSLLSLLVGTFDLSFDAELAGGEVEGRYRLPGDATEVKAEIENLNLRQLGILRTLIGLPASGIAKGEIDLVLADKSEDTQGSVKLAIENLQLGDGKAKLKAKGMNLGLTIPTVAAGDFNLQVNIDKGLARFEELRAKGKDIELSGSGTLQLMRPVDLSRLELMLRFRFSDAYKNRDEKTQALFSLMEFEPSLQSAQTSDGHLQYKLSGSLGSRIAASPAGKTPKP